MGLPFKIGDRVKILGGYCFSRTENMHTMYRRMNGAITEIIDERLVVVTFHLYGKPISVAIDRGSLARLKPKKKKVTKTIEGWVNVYKKYSSGVFKTKEAAECESTNNNDIRDPLIACVLVSGSYEVEE